MTDETPPNPKLHASTQKVKLMGGSRYITLPPEWLTEQGIKEGDDVVILANGDLKVCHIKKALAIYEKITETVKAD